MPLRMVSVIQQNATWAMATLPMFIAVKPTVQLAETGSLPQMGIQVGPLPYSADRLIPQC